MSDRYSSAYSEALRKNREEEKRKQRRFGMKEKVKSFIPFRINVKAKKDDGTPPLRTSKGQFKDAMKIQKDSRTPANAVYVQSNLLVWKDLSNTDMVRKEALQRAEDRIEQDPQFRKYYYKYAQATLGGQPSKQMNDETKKFINNSFKNFPKTREDRIKYAVADFMATKYDYYRNMIDSSSLTRREKWIRRYGEV